MTPKELREEARSQLKLLIVGKTDREVPKLTQYYDWHTRGFYERFPDEVSKEELDAAEKRGDRFIKNLYGVNLYLYPLPLTFFEPCNPINWSET